MQETLLIPVESAEQRNWQRIFLYNNEKKIGEKNYIKKIAGRLN